MTKVEVSITQGGLHSEATHKKKRVTSRQPPDDYRQSYGWSRDRYPGSFAGGTFFGRFGTVVICCANKVCTVAGEAIGQFLRLRRLRLW